MSMAFEITPEDVANVFERNQKPISEERAEEIYSTVIFSEADRIEKAALRGLDMETQTQYAYDEIEQILKENKLL